MMETMEQYMSKTRGNYGSEVARPKINDKTHFEIKGQFLKELRENTLSGSEHKDANEYIEKFLEIVDLFHIPEVTQDQIMLRAFHMSLSGAEVILFYNGLNVPTRKILDSESAIPTKIDADAKVAIQEMAEYSQKWHNRTSSKTKSTETSDGLDAIQSQLNSLEREIKKLNEKVYVAQVGCELCKGPHYTKECPLKEKGKTEKLLKRLNTHSLVHHVNREDSTEQQGQDSINATTETLPIRNQGASIKTLEIQIGQMSKVLQEIGFESLPSSIETNPIDHVKSISTTKVDSNEICRIGSSPYAVSDSQYSNIFFETVPFPRRLNGYCCDDWKEARKVKILKTYDHTLPPKEKDLGSFTLPCFIHNVCFDKALVDLGENVSVMPFSTYTNLDLGYLAHTRLTVELADRTIKHLRGMAKNVLVRISKFIFPETLLSWTLIE
ncbi:hypothetical protein Tco_0714544, partial [Tanacetum coccineum]